MDGPRHVRWNFVSTSRERINQAKRRLIESDDPVKEIARQVGYADQFFFSKDFKRMTKLTPTQFRDQERQN